MKKTVTLVGSLALVSVLIGAVPVGAQARAGGSDEIAALGDRMVGTWEGQGSRHVFEWGVGRRVVKSRSFFPEGDDWVLVSEGWWYWDPAVEAIRGKLIAIDMPGELFEYTTRVGEHEIVHDLVLHGDMGGTFIERWVFEEDGYTWSLEQDGERLMGGAYTRVH